MENEPPFRVVLNSDASSADSHTSRTIKKPSIAERLGEKVDGERARRIMDDYDNRSEVSDSWESALSVESSSAWNTNSDEHAPKHRVVSVNSSDSQYYSQPEKDREDSVAKLDKFCETHGLRYNVRTHGVGNDYRCTLKIGDEVIWSKGLFPTPKLSASSAAQLAYEILLSDADCYPTDPPHIFIAFCSGRHTFTTQFSGSNGRYGAKITVLRRVFSVPEKYSTIAKARHAAIEVALAELDPYREFQNTYIKEADSTNRNALPSATANEKYNSIPEKTREPPPRSPVHSPITKRTQAPKTDLNNLCQKLKVNYSFNDIACSENSRTLYCASIKVYKGTVEATFYARGLFPTLAQANNQAIEEALKYMSEINTSENINWALLSSKGNDWWWREAEKKKGIEKRKQDNLDRTDVKRRALESGGKGVLSISERENFDDSRRETQPSTSRKSSQTSLNSTNIPSDRQSTANGTRRSSSPSKISRGEESITQKEILRKNEETPRKNVVSDKENSRNDTSQSTLLSINKSSEGATKLRTSSPESISNTIVLEESTRSLEINTAETETPPAKKLSILGSHLDSLNSATGPHSRKPELNISTTPLVKLEPQLTSSTESTPRSVFRILKDEIQEHNAANPPVIAHVPREPSPTPFSLPVFEQLVSIEQKPSDSCPFFPKELPDPIKYPLHYAAAIGDFTKIQHLATPTNIRHYDNSCRLPIHWLSACTKTSIRNADYIEETVWLLTGYSDDGKKMDIRTMEILCALDYTYASPLAVAMMVDAKVAASAKRKRGAVGGSSGIVVPDFTGTRPRIHVSMVTQVLMDMDVALDCCKSLGSGRTCLHGLIDALNDDKVPVEDVVFYAALWGSKGKLDLEVKDWCGETAMDILKDIAARCENSGKEDRAKELKALVSEMESVLKKLRKSGLS